MADGGEMSLEDQKKLVLPFMQRAQEMDKVDPKVAYYCRLHAIDQAVSIPKRAKEVSAVVAATLSKLEKDKAALVLDKEQDRFHCEAFALRVFANADRTDRAGRGDLGTAKAYYAASCFLDVLNQFGPLDADLISKQKYALWRAAEIRKAAREGRPPVPPPSTSDGSYLDTEQLDLNGVSGPSAASFASMAGIRPLEGAGPSLPEAGGSVPGLPALPPGPPGGYAPPPPTQSFHYPSDAQPAAASPRTGSFADSGLSAPPGMAGHWGGGKDTSHATESVWEAPTDITLAPGSAAGWGGRAEPTAGSGPGTGAGWGGPADYPGPSHVDSHGYSAPDAPISFPSVGARAAESSPGPGSGLSSSSGYAPPHPPASAHGSSGGSGWGYQPPAAPPPPPPPAAAGYITLPALAPGHKASVQAIAEAQKSARTAVSSLNFEDVASAVKYLLHAVEVLTAPPNAPVKKL